MKSEQLPFGYAPHEHPVKDAVEIDVKAMSDEFLKREFIRLGTLYPEELQWKPRPGRLPAPQEFLQTIDQWNDKALTEPARKLLEKMVRPMQVHDKWVRRNK